ncbi:MAG: hypothetical protein KAT71_00240 [Gammaproteobacteria bacterium]|nr:hypothetical protein [Gammaproteobacteria bacterium]
MKLEMKEIENRFEKPMHEANSKIITKLTFNIGIISALLALVASVVHYIH